MPKYPTLEGFPRECAETSWLYDTMEVDVPYGPVSGNAKKQGPLPWDDATAAMWEASETDDLEPGAVGYQNETEGKWAEFVQAGAAAVRQFVGYPKAWKARIMPVTHRVDDLRRNIAEVYRIHAQDIELPRARPGAGRPQPPPQAIPLSMDDDTVQVLVDPETVWPNWRKQREESRRNIRDMWLEANALLWCALYALRAGESWVANRQEYDRKYAPTGRPGVAARPEARPPDPAPPLPDMKAPPPPPPPPGPEIETPTAAPSRPDMPLRETVPPEAPRAVAAGAGAAVVLVGFVVVALLLARGR